MGGACAEGDHALGFLLDCFSIGKGEFLPNPRNVIQLTPHVPSSSSWRSSRDSIQTKPRALTRCASCLQSPRLLETRLGRPAVPWLLAKRLFEELLKRKLAPLKAFSVSREFFISQSYASALALGRAALGVRAERRRDEHEFEFEFEFEIEIEIEIDRPFSRQDLLRVWGVDLDCGGLEDLETARTAGGRSIWLRFQSASIPIADRPVRRAVAASGAWEYEYADLFASTCPSTAPSNGS